MTVVGPVRRGPGIIAAMNFLRRRGNRDSPQPGSHDHAARGFQCSGCSGQHPAAPQAFHLAGPDAWSQELRRVKGCKLGTDTCVIRDEQFFILGLLRVAVAGLDEPFEWGLWVSLSQEDLVRMAKAWKTRGRESMPPVPGQLANNLPVFDEPTLGLRVLVHTQPVGLRPHIELVEDGHPLASEQRDGISHEAFLALVGQLLHAA
jgi:hypothetical protein